VTERERRSNADAGAIDRVQGAVDGTAAGPVLPPGTETERYVRLRRRFVSTPDRAYRAFTDPEEIIRWFCSRVEDGSLAVGTRSTLVWPTDRLWWEIVEAEPDRRVVIRWPWLKNRLVTTITITIDQVGYSSRIRLEDGPFPITEPGALDAWAEALEGWSEALAGLRAYLDYNVDLRMGD